MRSKFLHDALKSGMHGAFLSPFQPISSQTSNDISDAEASCSSEVVIRDQSSETQRRWRMSVTRLLSHMARRLGKASVRRAYPSSFIYSCIFADLRIQFLPLSNASTDPAGNKVHGAS